MSTTNAPRTRATLAREYTEHQQAIKAFENRGLDNLTAEEIAALEETLNKRDAVKAELDAMPGGDSFKDRIKEGDAFLHKPHRPAMTGAVKAAPDGVDDKGVIVEAKDVRADAGESATEKFLKRGPFKSLGHLCYEVRRSGSERPGMLRDGVLGEWNTGVVRYDDAIKAMPDDVKAASGLNELADSEGALAVPMDFATGIWGRTQGEDNLLTRIGVTPVTGNSLKIKAWNDKSRTGDVLFGGARAYWGQEAAQMTKSAPNFRDIDLRLNKLYVLMYATEELLNDAPALESELTRVAGACFVYKINKALIRGTGVGEPQGFLGAAAKITQAAVSGQGANTITAVNVDQMFARRSPGSNANLVWLYNIDAEQQLNALTIATGTASGQLVNMPPTGLAGTPNSSLKGRPMLEMEHCSQLGTEGDIILFDPTSHVAIVKSTGINQAVSMHVRFEYDETAFKFTYRVDARSRWEAPLTPAQSTNTRSPIVTLNSTRT